MSITAKLTSRRTFLKGMAAVGTASVLYGCGGAGDDEVIVGGGDGYLPPPDLNTEEYFFGTGGHNCGAKCLLKGWVKEGRILRITSSEDGYSGGVWQDPDSHNNTQSRACARCRGYRMRLYHPGRLKYPMKQTKKRGDLTGFVRISWEQALNEIARKHKATIGKYGPESINSLYSCGNYSGAYQGGGANGPWNGRAGASALLNMLGGATGYYSNYSFHQQGTFNTFFTGYGANVVAGAVPSANTVATCLNTVVLWGSNCLSTINNVANSTIQSYRKLRERGGKVIFIGPYLSDQGVNTATEWIQMRPYTDAALVAGMVHEMIIQTFNTDGSLKSGHWLDPEYLDIMVHGFFDSPGYWVHPTSGVIKTDADPMDSSVRINPVPAGKSFSAYIMGDDPRLTLARYDAANNYTAQQFKAVQTYRNAGVCSYPVARTVANTDYSRKKDYLNAKTPEWAEAITGVPREKIRELARIFCDAASHPLYSEYCGGQQKQAEGVNNMFAVQALHIITQTYGRPGETYNRGQAEVTSTAAAEQLPDMALYRPATAGGFNLTKSLPTPYVSCTMWHAAVKFGLGDDLKNNQYTAKYIPDWDPSEIASGAAYHDDGGAKALVRMKRDTAGNYIENADGYFEWEVDSDSKPIYSGYRLIYNMGGNIPINQHQNANDSADMLASLPLTVDPDDPDTFCIVNFDNFLSPSPRWSDYVLPAATVWEMDNRIGISLGNNIITPIITQPPGESKDTWALCVEFLRAFEKIDPTKAGCAEAFIGSDTPSGPVYSDDTYLKKFKRAYEGWAGKSVAGSKFYGLTFEEALKVQYSNRTPGAESVVADTKNALRTAVDAYLATLSSPSSTPFVPGVTIPNAGNTTYGGNNGYPYSMFPSDVTPPNIPNKLILYSEIFVFQYVNRFRKWHGYITDPTKRGQKNTDPEGDPIIYPIPMYFPYEDYFMEAYGGLDKLPTTGNRFLLTTTHDRYRSHSTLAEAPYLRELTHRIKGGKLYSGNDWGTYAISEIKDGAISRINKSIAERDFTRASWTEVYMNAEDAADLNIADGELIQLENPIGAVRVIARLTNRNVRGYLDLHQGCWYDPDPEDGVDDGGCANTLMATKPSRYDHGNGQQSAMVSIKKVQW